MNRPTFRPALLAAALSALILAACGGGGGGGSSNEPEYVLPPAGGSTLPYTVLTTLPNGTEVRNGGYGSAMTAHPSLAGHFYAMTDRGPNADYTGEAGAGKKFPAPDYTPRIAHFQLNAQGGVELVETILLKDRSGKAITGLPNETFGATGEIPYANDGSLLPYDPYGLDSEGLVAMADGTFWVSDEYGPHMVHYRADGTEIDRINPFAEDSRGSIKLPAEFAKRRANRGMEGLTVTPDGKTLVGIMQSTLDNPKAARNNDLTRLVTVNLQTGATAQYLYRQDGRALSNSEIVAISATRFLVIERDGNFYGDGNAKYKNVYAFDISQATNVDGSNSSLVNSSERITTNASTGLQVDGKTLESAVFDAASLDAGWAALAELGIRPGSKSLVVDALASLKYPHDKMEGLWLIDSTHLGIINDDDFAVNTDGAEVTQKVLPGSTNVDANTLYVVELPTALY